MTFFHERHIDLDVAPDLESVAEYEPNPGEHVEHAAQALCRFAALEGRAWSMTFNGTRVSANPGDKSQDVITRWVLARRP